MATKKPPQSARAIVNDFLAQFGLGALGEWAWQQYTRLGGGSDALSYIGSEMTKQPAFKARFPAYDALAKAGKAMSPAEMLAYEDAARQIFHDAGLPPSFYDSPDDFAKFMVADVSAAELQGRVQIAQKAAVSAPAQVRSELQRLYGIDQGQLTAYWLDPAKARPILERQYTSAEIASQATTTGFGTLDRTMAEQLAAQGVTGEQAQAGFGELAQSRGLFDQQVQGEDAIDNVTQIGATFSNDAAAKLRIKRRQQSRKADFGGGTGFGATDKGVTSLGTADASRR